MKILGIGHARIDMAYRVIKFDDDTIQVKDNYENCVEISVFEGTTFLTITNKQNTTNIENSALTIKRFHYDIAKQIFNGNCDKVLKIVDYLLLTKNVIVDEQVVIELNI